MAEHKLYRSKKGILGGVIQGIANHLDIDPILIRIPFVYFTLLTGLIIGILLYIIFWVAVPSEED
jgi:phage shock protein C